MECANERQPKENNRNEVNQNESDKFNTNVEWHKADHSVKGRGHLNSHWKKKFTLHRKDVNPQFRIPFIITGYRSPNLNALESLYSAFVPSCNESINFWSHFIAFVLFIAKFKALFSRDDYSLDDSIHWPLLSAALGICGFCFASSSAHMFNSMSPSAQHCCFFMDYAAIGVYSVGVGQAFFFYARPIAPEIFPFKSAQPFTIISQLTSITTTLLCCLSRLYWTKHKYLIRTSSFVAPFLVNASPYLYRMIYCANDVDCISQDSLWVFQIHCFFYIASALINILRVPERVYPGKFDLLGHSHHFLHIFTAIGASYQFDSINLDMRARKSELMKLAVQCNYWNTILSFLISVIMNFGIALIFGSKAGEHTAEKHEKEKTT